MSKSKCMSYIKLERKIENETHFKEQNWAYEHIRMLVFLKMVP